MKAILTEAQNKIKAQAALLERLTAAPFVYAMVLATDSRVQLVEQDRRIGETAELKDGRTGLIESVDKSNRRLMLAVPSAQKTHEWTNPSLVKEAVDKHEVGNTVNLTDGRSGKIIAIDPGDRWLNLELPYLERYWFQYDEVEPLPPTEEVHAFAVIIFENKLMEVEHPTHLNVSAGDSVKLSTETMQIVDVANELEAFGEMAIVRRVLSDSQVEVDHEGNVRVVFSGKCGTVEKGDRVILDASFALVLRNLGKQEERFTVGHDTNVTWNDIGGLVEAKQQMVEAIEMPHRYGELYAHYNKKPVKGVLLYGPPGCGKTMLGKATATALANLYGSTSSSGFFYVKGPEILDKFIGVAEATVRQLFERARKHKLEHGYPAVIFFDEADALMGKRGTGISSDIRDTIVPMFLTEMDGLDESAAVVILATNRPDILDPAIVRDGRIDRKIKVTRPNQDNTAEIFELYLKDIPLNNGYTVPELAQSASEELFSSTRALYTIDMQGGTSLDFSLREVVNGAMIAGIVDQATSKAMRRDMQAEKPGGLCQSDLIEAVEDVFRQTRDLNHDDELVEFTSDFQQDVVNIRRYVAAAA